MPVRHGMFLSRLQPAVAADVAAAAQAAGLMPPAKKQRGASVRKQETSPTPQARQVRYFPAWHACACIHHVRLL